MIQKNQNVEIKNIYTTILKIGHRHTIQTRGLPLFKTNKTILHNQQLNFQKKEEYNFKEQEDCLLMQRKSR